MKKILVVGGTGFIGYHIIKEAVKRKWLITSISLNKPKKKRFCKNVNYKTANLTNYKSLKKNLKGHYDYVINAGGYGNHPDFNSAGIKLFKTHYIGLVNLIKILSKKKIKKFIQIGSSAEYGKIKSPQKENFECKPNTPYAIAKFSCTNFLLNFCKLNNFPGTVLRLFLVYGPNQDKNRILPQIIENSLKNKKFPVTEGRQYCDFCYINDVVKAIFNTLLSKKSNGEIINIGFGNPVKIKNIINFICKSIGMGKPQFGKIKYRKDVNMKLYPDITKAKRLLNWKPKIKFEQGIRFTVSSYKTNE